MSSNKRLNRIELASYLKELKLLSCSGDVDKSRLSSIEEVEIVRSKASNLDKLPIKKNLFGFDELATDTFLNFKKRLLKLNSSPVYLWTPRTNSCGLYSVDSIEAVNFKFPFNVNPDGIVVVMSIDLEDKLLLDFYENSDGKKVVEVEIVGNNWSNVDLN